MLMPAQDGRVKNESPAPLSAADHSTTRHRRQSLLLALGGFILLAFGDAVVKTVSGQWPGSAFAALRYCFGSAGLIIFLLVTRGRTAFIMPRPWLQIGRAAAVSISALCFFVAVQMMPLATSTAVAFTTPMITALLSVILLRERAPLLVWGVTALAFAGVLIVLQPSFAGIGAAALFPLVGAFSMAVLMILNRVGADSGSPIVMQMLISSLAAPMLVAATALLHLTGIPAFHVTVPHWSVVARAALVACSATTAHWLIYLATIRTSAAVIAPTIYVQMLFAILLGVTLFGDIPDLATVAGSALIIVAGIVLFRGSAVKR